MYSRSRGFGLARHGHSTHSTHAVLYGTRQLSPQRITLHVVRDEAGGRFYGCFSPRPGARLTTENSNACNKTGIFVANVKRWKRLPISWPICGAYCILQHTARARSSILNHDYYSTFSVDSVRSSAAFVSRAVLIRQCSEAEGCVRCFFAPRASLLAAPPRRCCVLAAASCRAASSRSQRTLISSQA